MNRTITLAAVGLYSALLSSFGLTMIAKLVQDRSASEAEVTRLSQQVL